MAGLFGFGSSNSTATTESAAPVSEFLPDTPEPSEPSLSQYAETSAFLPPAQSISHSNATVKPEHEPIELIFIDEHPHMKNPTPRQRGYFGPIPMRTGYDKLLYGTGVSYLSGLSYGAVYGVIRGLQTAQVPNFKVRMNSIVNQTTRYGPWAANSLGVMTMTWAIMDNTLSMIRGKSDYFNHISAAFASGILFKSTAGIRPAVITGSILASIVSGYGIFEYAMASKTHDSTLSTSKQSNELKLPALQLRKAATA
ncbi:hypothetical protein BATDEDRAFT_91477 [Batrachochytrium dendrobatidis JAM81]|uniref:Mitochondrial import inner membrane translocase subunit TIM23 n=2 Tax=Batrachochytrium dendrobatidis TaxID=109871 RepID=F4PB37_BATDJ|nr:protein transporter TIM23 [Batrachochytrium dendrobatidis JAM81]EGF77785.1 hypothetical protein BATDEDRAFT_91477 [Batrachochytrium dendrobatidis JAM81]KAJ8323738.1 Mitochondrial import inner membrane translocase subunit tim23 [Batrachochytrium dendrobatidis]KAK5666341.1 Mitochondrial import inner membrane translocase subunit tim23 [Batrachochytrium dendrobatidis]OAJ43095.1 hypothetical protein BDEG_26479 [Batrachochytrium dendrobatidis JEL423]|eukprot:XP_006681842.1 hypothetical protein BATDEDRAFT_91477 [Batrachochytrium dendrobatidis JAM81]